MSEFRFDPIKNTWVILALERGHRPSQYQSGSQAVQEPETCPLCPGNESMTPPEVYALRSSGTEPDGPGWQVRVVPNKYPALSTEYPFEALSEGIHCQTPGFGIHEVIIESPVRDRQMADMDDEEVAEILMVFRNRMQSHHLDGHFKTVIIFKNHGREAGASLVHSHTQLIALPIIPSNVAVQMQSFNDHKAEEGSCLMCGIVEKEIAEKTRVVLNENGYLAMAPFAASSPFQLNIVAKTHNHDFSMSSDKSLVELAPVLLGILRRLRSILGEHPWNMVIHNAPVDPTGEEDHGAFHWFMEITPRLTKPAGFELGSGIGINTVAPEECAEILRTQDAGRSTQ